MTDFRRTIQRRRTPAIDRFLAKVVTQPDGCMIWTACTNQGGYGNFRDGDGRWVRAHRWHYEHVNGPIPPGLMLDHLCRVRACVNASHLRPVTHRENQLAPGSQSDSAKKARQTACLRGHRYIPANMHRSSIRLGLRRCRACSNANCRANDAYKRTGVRWPEARIRAYADAKYAGYLSSIKDERAT